MYYIWVLVVVRGCVSSGRDGCNPEECFGQTYACVITFHVLTVTIRYYKFYNFIVADNFEKYQMNIIEKMLQTACRQKWPKFKPKEFRGPGLLILAETLIKAGCLFLPFRKVLLETKPHATSILKNNNDDMKDWVVFWMTSR